MDLDQNVNEIPRLMVLLFGISSSYTNSEKR